MDLKRFLPFLFVGWALLLPVRTLPASGLASDPLAYFWVGFSDKLDSPFSADRPQEFLSSRAIARRQRQGISVSEADLPVNPGYVDSLLSDTSIQLMYTSRWLNGAVIGISREQSVSGISQLGFVREVMRIKPGPSGSGLNAANPDEHVKREKPAGRLTPRVLPDKFEPFGLNDLAVLGPHVPDVLVEPAEYGEARTQVEQLNGVPLHAAGFRGEGVHIAVLDAGFMLVDELWTFERLRSEGRLLGVKDFVDPGGNVFRSHTHGMAVLSVMAAYSPGQLLGTAPDASYWLLRTEDVASEYRIEEYNWLAAAEFADSAGVDIINSSLGYTRFDDPEQDYVFADLDGRTTVVSRAANMAFERGMLVVNSAGNYGAREWRYIGAPADAPGALAVGAVDAMGMRTDWSSEGPSADGRIKPDVMAMGLRVSTINIHNGLSQVNGTSFSSPLVAGMAACLWQRFPDLHAADIRQLIIQSADRFRMANTYDGNGIPDFGLAAGIPMEPIASQAIALVPNPLATHSMLEFFSDRSFTMEVQLINSTGWTVYTSDGIPVREGHNRIGPFSGISHLPQGVYLVRMLGDGFHHAIKALWVK